MKRRDFIRDSAVSVLAAGAVSQRLPSKGFAMQTSSTSSALPSSEEPVSPDEARMVISISMQMEAGAQPSSGAESPTQTARAGKKYKEQGAPAELLENFQRVWCAAKPELPTTKWYDLCLVSSRTRRWPALETSLCPDRRTRRRYLHHSAFGPGLLLDLCTRSQVDQMGNDRDRTRSR
jgi:hypothetical protein